MTMQPLRPEDPHEIGGHRLLGRLGGGGMGQVFLGRSPGGRPVAVKLVLPGLAADDGFRRRFAQEVEAARRVGGFHTAQVVDADPAADPPWLVTAYVPGPSLQEAVEAHGPLPARTVQALGAGLAEGLAAIHACGLVHRDLKPGNVILAADGPRIIDFGIARAMDGAGVTATGSVIGTPGFMSPEQAGGEPDLGPASDVFALGSMLTYAATGGGPFDGGSVASIVYRIVSTEPDLSAVPPPLRDLISACLAKDPADRPAIADVLRVLSASDDTTDTWLPPAVTAMIAERDVSTGPDAAPPAPSSPGAFGAQPPPPAFPSAEHGAPSPPSGTTPYPYAQGGGAWTPPPMGGWQGAGGPVQPVAAGMPPPYTPAHVPTYPGGAPSRPSGPDGTRLAVAGVAALAVVLLAAVGLVTFSATRDGGRAGTAPTSDVQTGAPVSPPSPSGSATISAAGLVGDWEGTYTCTQGLTGLQLTISESSTGNGLEATFRFFAHPSNPSVPSGTFAMRGTFTGGVLELNGDHWIDRPDDYLMVDLSARVPEAHPTGISGTVKSSGSSCTSFTVRRR